MLEFVSLGAHLWSLDVDSWHIPCQTELGWCSSGIVLTLLLKALMICAFTTLSGKESTTRWMKVCLRNKSRLLSLNSLTLEQSYVLIPVQDFGDYADDLAVN